MGEKRLTFNLATQSLNGVAIDDPFDKIRLFGRPENREPFARQIFDYPHLGLEIGGENGRVKYFSFAMRHLPSAEAKPCELTFVGERGASVFLSRNTKFDEVENILGKPFQREEFHEEAVYRFRFRFLTLEFEIGQDGLISFEVGAEDFV